MIEPGIGRALHYRPDGADPAAQPHAATVIFVHGNRSVNLACFSPAGTYYHREEVPLLQDDDTAPATGGYAEWMPFQKGQAVKTEAAESDLAPRLTELEQLLTAGGPVHTLVSDMATGIDGKLGEVKTDVDAKFKEVGDYLLAKFTEIEQRIATPIPANAVGAAEATDPAANPPGAPNTPPDAGAAPQAQA
jgi:hypothetical protein